MCSCYFGEGYGFCQLPPSELIQMSKGESLSWSMEGVNSLLAHLLHCITASQNMLQSVWSEKGLAVYSTDGIFPLCLVTDQMWHHLDHMTCIESKRSFDVYGFKITYVPPKDLWSRRTFLLSQPPIEFSDCFAMPPRCLSWMSNISCYYHGIGSAKKLGAKVSWSQNETV